MTLLLIALLLIFTLCSGFFSLALIGLFSLPTSEVKFCKNSPDKKKQLIASLLKRPRDLLVTLLFCDIAANIFIQNTASSLFGKYSNWFLQVGVPLVITLFLGEILPKTIALSYNTHIAYSVSPVIARIQKLLGPLQKGMTWLTTRLSSVLFFFLKKENDISKAELRHVLKSSENYGILNRDEATLVQGYLSLTDYTVKERMQPRGSILFYDVDDPLSKLIYLFVERECSRIPVCREDLQNLLGILTARDFFQHKNTIKEGNDLLALLTPPYYVPETIFARTLLRQFFQKNEKMGIVVDEYGAISGLITQEDLFEVVVGEIADVRDEKIRYTTAGKNVIITSGKFELDEFEQLFHVALPAENSVTLGGWLTERLGDIPKSGTQYIWNGFLFQVLAADANRVRRIYIRRLVNE